MNNAVNEKTSLSPNGKNSSGVAATLAATWKKITEFFTSGSLERRKSRAGWVFVLPFVIGMIFIYAPVIINSISYSFSVETKEIVDKTVVYYYKFVGWQHYAEAFLKDTDFVQSTMRGNWVEFAQMSNGFRFNGDGNSLYIGIFFNHVTGCSGNICYNCLIFLGQGI